MKTSMMPGCCGLKTIHELSCIGKADELSKKQAALFDDMVKPGTAQEGMWATYNKALDTIAIITSSLRYNPKTETFAAQKKFLEDKGWRLLASWKNHESGATNYMYGSPGITPEAKPAEVTK